MWLDTGVRERRWTIAAGDVEVRECLQQCGGRASCEKPSHPHALFVGGLGPIQACAIPAADCGASAGSRAPSRRRVPAPAVVGSARAWPSVGGHEHQTWERHSPPASLDFAASPSCSLQLRSAANANGTFAPGPWFGKGDRISCQRLQEEASSHSRECSALPDARLSRWQSQAIAASSSRSWSNSTESTLSPMSPGAAWGPDNARSSLTAEGSQSSEESCLSPCVFPSRRAWQGDAQCQRSYVAPEDVAQDVMSVDASYLPTPSPLLEYWASLGAAMPTFTSTPSEIPQPGDSFVQALVAAAGLAADRIDTDRSCTGSTMGDDITTAGYISSASCESQMSTLDGTEARGDLEELAASELPPWSDAREDAALLPGTRVVLRDLRNSLDLNGKSAVVVKRLGLPDGYEVELENTGETMSFWMANLVKDSRVPGELPGGALVGFKPSGKAGVEAGCFCLDQPASQTNGTLRCSKSQSFSTSQAEKTNSGFRISSAEATPAETAVVAEEYLLDALIAETAAAATFAGAAAAASAAATAIYFKRDGTAVPESSISMTSGSPTVLSDDSGKFRYVSGIGHADGDGAPDTWEEEVHQDTDVAANHWTAERRRSQMFARDVSETSRWLQLQDSGRVGQLNIPDQAFSFAVPPGPSRTRGSLLPAGAGAEARDQCVGALNVNVEAWGSACDSLELSEEPVPSRDLDSLLSPSSWALERTFCSDVPLAMSGEPLALARHREAFNAGQQELLHTGGTEEGTTEAVHATDEEPRVEDSIAVGGEEILGAVDQEAEARAGPSTREMPFLLLPESSLGERPAEHCEQEMEAEEERPSEIAKRLRSENLGGECLTRICLLSGPVFQTAGSEELVKDLANRLDASMGSRAIFITEGMPGPQKAFARACGDGSRIVNLVPAGHSSGYGVGTDLQAGRNMMQRRQIYAQLGDIYITIEGGPQMALTARQALDNGANLVPLLCTGGASAGSFGFPQEALEKPRYVAEEDWAVLGETDTPIEMVSAVVTSLVVGIAVHRNMTRCGLQWRGGQAPHQMPAEEQDADAH